MSFQDPGTDQTPDQAPAPPPQIPNVARPVTPLIRLAQAATPPPPQMPTPPQAPQISQSAPFRLAQGLPEQGSAAARADPYQPYIGSPRARPPDEWGKPDLIHEGAMAYKGGVAPGPYMPQPNDFSRMVPAIAMGLGRFGSGYTRGSAIGMASFAAAYVKAVQQGQMFRAQMHREQFQESLRETAERQKQESKEYGEAWALYGPKEGEKHDEPRMRQALWEIAWKYGDDRMKNVLSQEGLAQAEKLAQFRDTQGQDASKLYTQMIKQQQLDNLRRQGELQQQKIDKEKARLQDERRNMDWWKQGGSGPGPGPSSASPSTGAPVQDFDAWSKSAQPPPTSQAETPDPGPGDMTDPGTGATAAEGRSDLTDPAQGDTSPREDLTSQAEPQQPAPEQMASQEPTGGDGEAPVRVAEADTGTMSDAPPPEAGALAGQRVAQADQAAPAGVKGRGTAALGGQPARAPAPGATGATTGMAPHSAVLDQLRREGWNDQGVRNLDQLALDIVNGAPSSHIQNLQAIPKEVRAAANARVSEINQDIRNLINNPNIHGSQVYDELNKINPEFSRALRGMVNGDFKIQQSAWRNPTYRSQLIGLGQKVDQYFTEASALARFKAVLDVTSGQSARTITGILTADHHLDTLESSLSTMSKSGAYVGGALAGSTLANRINQYFTTEVLPDRYGNPTAKSQILNFQSLVHLIAPEVARAQKGAAPTKGEINDVEDKWLSARDPESLKLMIESARGLFHQRMDQIHGQWTRASGGHPFQSMDRMFDQFGKRQGFGEGGDPSDTGPGNDGVGFVPGPAKGTGVQPPVSWDPATGASAPPGGWGNALRAFEARKPGTSAPSSPRAPAQGEVQDGWQYQGGDPADRNSWKRVGQ